MRSWNYPDVPGSILWGSFYLCRLSSLIYQFPRLVFSSSSWEILCEGSPFTPMQTAPPFNIILTCFNVKGTSRLWALVWHAKSKSHCNWRSVSQYVLVSSPNLGLFTRFFFRSYCLVSFGAPSLTRSRVCNVSVLVIEVYYSLVYLQNIYIEFKNVHMLHILKITKKK
jgi:hypothetical protein